MNGVVGMADGIDDGIYVVVAQSGGLFGWLQFGGHGEVVHCPV